VSVWSWQEAEAAVASFVTRVLIVLSAALGSAMLDLGAQASAAFLAVASSAPAIDVDADGVDSSRPADVWRDQFDRPPPQAERPNLHWAHIGSRSSSSGGAGSSTGLSTGPGPETFDSVAVAGPAPPILVTRHYCPEAPSVLLLLTAAIFEPPRSGR
jgi:hypothetical protein